MIQKIENYKNEDIGKLVVRFTAGFLMLFHGLAKLSPAAAEGTAQMIGLPGFFGYGLYITEIVAPIFILVGFKTKLSSIAYIFGMLVAIFGAHAKDIFSLNNYGGWAIELQMLFLFAAVAVFFLGNGKYAIEKK